MLINLKEFKDKEIFDKNFFLYFEEFDLCKTLIKSGKKIFTGEVWEAARAKDLGLIDGIGHLETVITEKFGEDGKLKKLERKRGLFSKFGKASIDSIFDTIYEKIVYSKFRL